MNSVLFILTLLSFYRFYELDRFRASQQTQEEYSEEEDHSWEKDDSDEESNEIQDLHQIQIHSLHVQSTVRYRYARTVVFSRIVNHDKSPREVTFSFAIPASALVSGFQVESDGQLYKAQIGKKIAAKDVIQHHYVSHRDTNKIALSTTLKPETSALFNLTYEEVLMRRSGYYRHVISMDPGQVVPDLKVHVFVVEPKGLAMLDVLPFVNGTTTTETDADKTTPHAKVNMIKKHVASISYSPTTRQQRIISNKGINGQFIVHYDVVRQPMLSNELLVKDGYFLHFFSNDQLKPLPKHVTFVLDVSGSMMGGKLEQMRQAMNMILTDLRSQDYFSIITYSTDVRIWLLDSPYFWKTTKWKYVHEVKETSWESMVVPANEVSKMKAKAIIQFIWAEGASNIYGALKQAVKLSVVGGVNLRNSSTIHQSPESIIIFLTDGTPTEGETNTCKIIDQITKYNKKGQAAIFTVALGEHADLTFLKKLSSANSGFARKIHEASDTALQLTHFYREVASPLLANVTFNYLPNQIMMPSLTATQFPYMFAGSELVVAGKLNGAASMLVCNVTGRSADGATSFEMEHIANATQDVERLWANLILRQLMERGEQQQATLFALQYEFLTPLTSFSITLPDKKETTVEIYSTTTGQQNSQEDFKIVRNELSKEEGKERKEGQERKEAKARKEGKEEEEEEEEEDDDESTESQELYRSEGAHNLISYHILIAMYTILGFHQLYLVSMLEPTKQKVE